ncbi:hypothetical protein SK128_018775 [Halocaridina rubra]|uniref:Uncharacterized protein n=1 Tax=Halocaridina rubra TaxID=373956 RepID=A0AAN9AAF9_HALRR
MDGEMKENETLREQIRSLEEANKAQGQERKELEKRIKKLEGEKSQLESRISNQEDKNKQLNDNLKELDDQERFSPSTSFIQDKRVLTQQNETHIISTYSRKSSFAHRSKRSIIDVSVNSTDSLYSEAQERSGGYGFEALVNSTDTLYPDAKARDGGGPKYYHAKPPAPPFEAKFSFDFPVNSSTSYRVFKILSMNATLENFKNPFKPILQFGFASGMEPIYHKRPHYYKNYGYGYSPAHIDYKKPHAPGGYTYGNPYVYSDHHTHHHHIHNHRNEYGFHPNDLEYEHLTPEYQHHHDNIYDSYSPVDPFTVFRSSDDETSKSFWDYLPKLEFGYQKEDNTENNPLRGFTNMLTSFSKMFGREEEELAPNTYVLLHPIHDFSYSESQIHNPFLPSTRLQAPPAVTFHASNSIFPGPQMREEFSELPFRPSQSLPPGFDVENFPFNRDSSETGNIQMNFPKPQQQIGNK